MDAIYSNGKNHHGNDVRIPIELIKQSPHLLNKANKYGDTLLHEACGSDQIEVVKTLLDMGARVNLRNNDKESPIHKCRSAETLQTLIDHGARVNAQNRYGQTLIHLCAEDPFFNDINIVKTAIANGGNKYIRDRNGKSPYDIAMRKRARQDYLDLMK